MSRTRSLAGLVSLLVLPALLSAQATADRPVSIGVSGGLSLPMGDLGDGVDAGYNLTGHLYFKPASFTAVRLRADVSWDSWKYKDNGVVDLGSLRTLGVSGNVIYDFPTSGTSVMRPYLLGGLGFYNSKASEGGSESSSDMGIQAGIGLSFNLSGFSTFAEAKYVNVFSDGSANWIPITFGFRF
jgi:opacity protein-like surface antigen